MFPSQVSIAALVQNIKQIKVHYVTNADQKKQITFYINFCNVKSFQAVKKKIENYLFKEGKFTRTVLRFYWLDNDGDEIVILNNDDLKYYILEESGGKDLWVKGEEFLNKPKDTISKISKENVGKKPNTNNNNSKKIDNGLVKGVTHVGVKCASCSMWPIVGFRYKCIECHDYDICENCERKHTHPDHIMMRMPNNNCSKMLNGNFGKCNSCSDYRNVGANLEEIAALNAEARMKISDGENRSLMSARAHRKHRLLEHVYGMFESGMNLPEIKNVNTDTPIAQIQSNAKVTGTAATVVANNANMEVKPKQTHKNNAQQPRSAGKATAKFNQTTGNKNESCGKSTCISTEPLTPLELVRYNFYKKFRNHY